MTKNKMKIASRFSKAVCFLLIVMLFILSSCMLSIDTSDDASTPSSIFESGDVSLQIDSDESIDESIDESSEDESNGEAVIPPEDSTFEVHFIDVGQADAALVICDGKTMLIDGGNKGDSSKIYTYLKNQGVTHLDYIVGTHAHEDHIGGIPGALNLVSSVGKVYCPVTEFDSNAFADFKKYVEAKGKTLTVPTVGEKFMLGSAEVLIVGCDPAAEDPNNTSIVLKITYKQTSFLFTGDAEASAEEKIVNSGYDLSATVLKVGHHGADTSTSYRFLREILPEIAIISVGKDNSYGHPTEKTLSILEDADAKIYRTDLSGDLIVKSDGENVSVTTSKNEQTENDTSSSLPSEPTEKYDYVLNKNTKKFHYPSCNSVASMSEANKEFYNGTRDELIADGYKPCGNCHP